MPSARKGGPAAPLDTNQAFAIAQEIGHTQWMAATLANPRDTLSGIVIAGDLSRLDLEDAYSAGARQLIHCIGFAPPAAF